MKENRYSNYKNVNKKQRHTSIRLRFQVWKKEKYVKIRWSGNLIIHQSKISICLKNGYIPSQF